MPRQTWTPNNDVERRLLDELDNAVAHRDRAEAQLWEVIREARVADIPAQLLAGRAGVSRATLYRRLDELMKARPGKGRTKKAER